MTGNLQGVKLLNPKYFRLLGTTQAGLPEFVAANLDKLVTSENSSSVIQLLQQISSNIGQASGSSSIVSSLAASLAATSVDDTAGPDGKMPTALEVQSFATVHAWSLSLLTYIVSNWVIT